MNEYISFVTHTKTVKKDDECFVEVNISVRKISADNREQAIKKMKIEANNVFPDFIKSEPYALRIDEIPVV